MLPKGLHTHTHILIEINMSVFSLIPAMHLLIASASRASPTVTVTPAKDSKTSFVSYISLRRQICTYIYICIHIHTQNIYICINYKRLLDVLRLLYMRRQIHEMMSYTYICIYACIFTHIYT
jgi:hypothetical protein